MQHTVHDKARQLFTHADAMPLCLFACNIRTDVDVGEHHAIGISAECEGDHVRWTNVAKMLLVECRDCTWCDERD